MDEPSLLIKFELHGARPNEKTTAEYRVANCKENPITIPIHHDMTKPFFKTRYIQMKFGTNIKIAAVSLRSPKYFDPVGLQDCTGMVQWNGIEWDGIKQGRRNRGWGYCRGVTARSKRAPPPPPPKKKRSELNNNMNILDCCLKGKVFSAIFSF